MDANEPRRWDRVIVWFRRDLRLVDHPALVDAVTNARSVVPLFVVDRRLVSGPRAAAARNWYLRGSLETLHEALARRGSGLLVVEGRPEEVVPALAGSLGAEAVLATRDVTPYSHRRDRAVAHALASAGRRLLLRPGLLLVEPDDMLNASGRPFAMFSPFWRSLQRRDRRELLAPPDSIPTPMEVLSGPSEQLRALAPVEPPRKHLPEPGEHAAGHRLRGWVSQALDGYDEARNELSGEGTSHLGPDLHLGLLSPLQVETAAVEAGGDAATSFVRQLAWRELYHHTLWHARESADRTPRGSLMGAFRSESEDPEAAAAWREGRTGVPVVDAAMRQLATSGWLSNRARLVVASFLTRHLLMDYRIGERHFMQHLIDGDVANNLGGWQWTAGVGSDPQPWFRIFNPVLQGRRFDPEGAWVRRWLPEIGRVPDEHVHAPWEMTADQAEEVGVHLGRTYPHPIVDLREARERALAAFAAATGSRGRPGSAGG